MIVQSGTLRAGAGTRASNSDPKRMSRTSMASLNQTSQRRTRPSCRLRRNSSATVAFRTHPPPSPTQSKSLNLKMRIADERPPMTFALTSSAFTDGGAMPTVYTCEGRDISPPLAWSGVPTGTKTWW